MIHIIRKPNAVPTKFEVLIVRNGEILVGSRTQGYERKEGCLKCIKSIGKEFPGATEVAFQDNSLEKPTQFSMSLESKAKPLATKKKAVKLPVELV